MVWDPERAIAHLLMLISCAGEHGCTVQDLLEVVRSLAPYSSSENDAPKNAFPDRACSEMWRWLVRRSDVSIGIDREFNHLSLYEISSPPQVRNTGIRGVQARNRNGDMASPCEGTGIRICISEATMWEAITGHAVDNKRVPRSEWLLLLGIASSKTDGILQGDLGRLVHQDKRSVPKRTDALMRKGYITKRTTLVRGTKTSKMWLRTLVPNVPRENDSNDESKIDKNLSRQTLAENIDPVSWRARWTGSDIDYKALAATIMAITKEWDVLRISDLKEKLGILGMRWQMKIVSKTCRFLNMRGAVQFVAAVFDDRVFKDCIKFVRDMTAQEWAIYLSTGKHREKAFRNHDPFISEEGNDGASSNHHRASHSRLSMCPQWTQDKPLPQTIFSALRLCGTRGVSNPEIYILMLGASFNRFLSSMTGSLSTAGIQPSHLKYLQLRSEHVRTGKVASYFFLLPVEAGEPKPFRKLTSSKAAPHSTPTSSLYGFVSTVAIPTYTTCSLTVLCGYQVSSKQDGGWHRRPPSRHGANQQTDASLSSKFNENAVRADLTATSGIEAGKIQREACEGASHVIPPKFRPEALRPPAKEEIPRSIWAHQGSHANREITHSEEFLDRAATLDDLYKRSDPGSDSKRSHTRIRWPSASKRQRGLDRRRQSDLATNSSSSRPWTCENCGKSWKNDSGLKYHLAKSRSSCNPSHVSLTPRLIRKGRQVVSLSRPKSTSLGAHADPMLRNDSSGAVFDKSIHGLPDDALRCFTDAERSGGAEAVVSQHRDQIPALQARLFRDSTLRGWTLTDAKKAPGQSLCPRLFDVLMGPHWTLPRWIAASNNRERRASRRSQGFLKGDEADPPLPAPEISAASVPAEIVNCGARLSKDKRKSTSAQPEHSIGSLARSQVPVEAQEASTISQMTASDTQKIQICNLIDRILHQNNGVILGGKSLCNVITAAWQAEVPDLPAPTWKSCQAAVKCMVRQGVVMEHWHAFRDSRGLFAKCQLILLPGTDAFSREAMHLTSVVKSALLVTEESPQMNNSDQFSWQGERNRVRGRRLLAEEVAILGAPVYAARIAAKRAAEASISSSCQTKRTRYPAKQDCNDRADPEPTQGPQSFRRTRSAANEPGEPGFWKNRRGPAGVSQFTAGIVFLDPNTCLDDESSIINSTKKLMPVDPQLTRHDVPEFEQLRRSPWLVSQNVSNNVRQDECGEMEEGVSKDVNKAPNIFDNIRRIRGSCGSWPNFDFEEFTRLGTSFTLSGWIPDEKWHRWAAFDHDLKQRIAAREIRSVDLTLTNVSHRKFLDWVRACADTERLWRKDFAAASPGDAGPHNIFICGPEHRAEEAPKSWSALTWPAEGQLTPYSTRCMELKFDVEEGLDSGEEEQPNSDTAPERPRNALRKSHRPITAMNERHERVKRVVLAARALTALPLQSNSTIELDQMTKDPDECVAAFVAIRSLLGGTDKAIDWGILAKLFPKAGLSSLRKFWVNARKAQPAYISNLTRVFQERVIAAFDEGTLPIIDYERPVDYDWKKLVQWTKRLPRLGDFRLPKSKKTLIRLYSLKDIRPIREDWREKYFHPISSTFARYEASSSEPGFMTVRKVSLGLESSSHIDELVTARSWIKSICSVGESNDSIKEVREKFEQFARGSHQCRSDLLEGAAFQLARERVISLTKKPLTKGPRYRINDWYTSTLEKSAQSAKYNDAALFKEKLDAAFKRGIIINVPYTLSDGATMALTNLYAAGRIHLKPANVPDIPFGFEPGNYESRKTPKSCFYFHVEVGPTSLYRYNEDIEVLQNVLREGPPRGGRQGRLPQWIDILENGNVQRWSELLGAVCFALATRGSTRIEGICSALFPLLDEFEARLIEAWGKRTGVFTNLMGDRGTTVGDWWWLAVPWARQQTANGKVIRLEEVHEDGNGYRP